MKLDARAAGAAVRGRRPHGLHRRRPARARLVRVRRAHDRRRPAARAGGQDDRAARRRDAAGRQALARRAHVLRRRHGVQRRLADRRARDCAASASSRPAWARTASIRAATPGGCSSPTAARARSRVISFRTRRPVAKWRLPGGGSPDMGGVSADGRVLWLSGRYDARGLRDQHAHRPAAAPHQGRQRPARHGGLAAARPLLDRPHRHPALSPQGARGRLGRSTAGAGRRRSPPPRARADGLRRARPTPPRRSRTSTAAPARSCGRRPPTTRRCAPPRCA